MVYYWGDIWLALQVKHRLHKNQHVQLWKHLTYQYHFHHSLQSSPPPARRPRTIASPALPQSPAQSTPTGPNSWIPDIAKWTVNGLRHALATANIMFARRHSKAQLYTLYLSSQTRLPPSTAPSPLQKPSSRPSRKTWRSGRAMSASSPSSVYLLVDMPPQPASAVAGHAPAGTSITTSGPFPKVFPGQPNFIP